MGNFLLGLVIGGIIGFIACGLLVFNDIRKDD